MHEAESLRCPVDPRGVLCKAADVTVYPYLGRQISVDELAANAKRADWLFVLLETPVTAEVINANPNLKGIGRMAGGHLFIDVEAANARKNPIVLEDKDPRPSVIPATGDLTIAMLLTLAYLLVDADLYTRCGNFRQEQTMALMGLGRRDKTGGLIGMGKLPLYIVPRLLPFGMQVIYTKPNRLPIERDRELGVEWTPISKSGSSAAVLCASAARTIRARASSSANASSD